jgi:CheY-like chemotaxis protein
MFGSYPQKLARLVSADQGNVMEQRETILRVEDEPAVRQLFSLASSRAGYRVHEARNGQEAMKMFDQHGEAIDLLLTDMRMPFMGGAELATQLRTRRKTLKLLCISAMPAPPKPNSPKTFSPSPSRVTSCSARSARSWTAADETVAAVLGFARTSRA